MKNVKFMSPYKKKAIETLYIQSYFEFVSTDSPWIYLIHLLNMPQLIFEQNSPWEESNICHLLPTTFQIFKFSQSIFEIRTCDLTLPIIFFTWKTATANLKSCIELNKAINTRKFCGKKTS